MEDKRKYPINERRFKELIEPFLEREKKKSGRPTKVSHYKFFCGVVIRAQNGGIMEGFAWRVWSLAYNIYEI